MQEPDSQEDERCELSAVVQRWLNDAFLLSRSFDLQPREAVFVALSLSDDPWAKAFGPPPVYDPRPELVDAFREAALKASKGEKELQSLSPAQLFERFRETRETPRHALDDFLAELRPKVLLPAARVGAGIVTPRALFLFLSEPGPIDEAAKLWSRPMVVEANGQRFDFRRPLMLEDAQAIAADRPLVVVYPPYVEEGESAEVVVEPFAVDSQLASRTPSASTPLSCDFQLSQFDELPNVLSLSRPAVGSVGDLRKALDEMHQLRQVSNPVFWLPLQAGVDRSRVDGLRQVLDVLFSEQHVIVSTEAAPLLTNQWFGPVPFADSLTVATAHALEQGARPDAAGANSDVIHGQRDALGQESVASAFAWIARMKSVEPPLCFGVLGSWGSGKSFFMNLMDKALRETTPDVSVALREQLLDEVRIIRFNAWTYAKSDLWSALLYEILLGLETKQRSRYQQEHQAWKRERKLKLEEQKLHELEAKRKALAEQLEKEQEKRSEHRQLMRIKLDAAQEARRLSEERAKAVAEHNRGASERLRRWLALLNPADKTQPGGVRVWLWVSLILLCTAIVLWGNPDSIVGQLKEFESRLISVIAGLAGLVAQAFATARGVFDKAQEEIGNAQGEAKKAADSFAKLLSEFEQEATTPTATEYEATLRDVSSARLEVEKARRKVLDLVEEQQQEDFEAFVQRRLSDGKYVEGMGPLHRVQLDLELIASHTARKNGTAPKRIVLMIDDLDRCPPDKVVQVLEAVQLMLAGNDKLPEATNPFVVVLGADTRILTRALECHYKDILMRDLRPSGLDYLEKIVQLPYWIAPIGKAGFERYVSALTGIDFPPRTTRTAAHLPTDQTTTAVEATEEQEEFVVHRETSELLDASDMAWFRQYQPLAAANARAVKRLVNQYRLCKVLGVASSGRKFRARETLFLLCIADGYRAATRLLMRALERADDAEMTVRGFFESLGDNLSADLRAEVSDLVDALDELSDEVPKLRQLQLMAQDVLPFCFLGDLGRMHSQQVSFSDLAAVDTVFRPKATS